VVVMRASSSSNLVPRRDSFSLQKSGNHRVPQQGYKGGCGNVVHSSFVNSSLVFWLTCRRALSCNSKTSCFCQCGRARLNRAWSFFRGAYYASELMVVPCGIMSIIKSPS
jgi:hypothetical protein